jgi:hypothetical protein
MTYIPPLMRHECGLFAKPENKDDELRMLDDGWVHHPPAGLPPKHGMANPDDEDLTGTPLVW